MLDTMHKQILESLSEVYISIFALDLETNEMYGIKSNPYIDKWSSIEGSLQEKMNNVMDNIVVDEHIEMIHNFTDFSSLKTRLMDKNVLTQVFQGKINGWCKARFIRMDEAGRYVLYTVECIDEEKKKEDYLRYLAQTDLMTGILNRGHGEHQIKKYLTNQRKGMFVLFDVDKFKRINDIYGHDIGDEVLIEIAHAMMEVKSKDDIIMRLGGDEFAAYFVDVEDTHSGNEIIKNLLNEISKIHVEPLQEKITVSLGAVIYEEGLDFESAYRKADKGVYESKLNKGSSYIFRR